MGGTNTTPNVTLDFSQAQPVQQGSPVTLDFSKAQPTNVSMVGPQGEKQQVPAENVAVMRQKNYAVTPDNPGVQRMATPQGKLTYALPSEVDQFKASGHVPIDDSGNFRVDPLPGEENTQTMDRAAAIAKGLPPDVLQKAIAAEKKTITPMRVAANLTVGPAAAAAIGLAPGMAATEATLAAPAAAEAVTSAGLRYLGRLAPAGIRAAAGGFAEQAGKMALQQGAKWVATRLLPIGGGIAGGGDLIYHLIKSK